MVFGRMIAEVNVVVENVIYVIFKIKESNYGIIVV